MQAEMTFTLECEGQEIAVRYRPRRFAGYDQFEFLSPHDPARPIPVSRTGYRSVFLLAEDSLHAICVEHLAREILAALLIGNTLHHAASVQLSLF